MLRWVADKQVNVVVFAVHLNQFCPEVDRDLGKDGAKPVDSVAVQYLISILCNEDQMNMKLENTVSTVSNLI